MIMIRRKSKMISIRPVSDLRNHFPEIEETVIASDAPVFLTKNGYGTMVLMSIEQYEKLTNNIEKKLDEAERSEVRYPASEVFGRVRSRIRESNTV